MVAFETRRRSVAKALSWRVFATLITMGVAWVLTGEVTLAVQIGAADTTLKLLTYFAHERLWQRVRWGTKRVTDYRI